MKKNLKLILSILVVSQILYFQNINVLAEELTKNNLIDKGITENDDIVVIPEYDSQNMDEPLMDGETFEIKEKREEEKKKKELEEQKKKLEEEAKKANNFEFELSSYSTKYSKGSNNRNYNMKLASDSINGLILKPGDTFSYNDVILKNSHNGKDYKEAGVFVNGKTSTGIGGGICQISSTLFQSALKSGMTITERRNHSLKVGYMPAGMDATASWGTIDFKFRNDLKVPVKIESTMNNGIIKVRFLTNEKIELEDIQISVKYNSNNDTYILKRYINGVNDYTTSSKYKKS